MLHAPFLLWVVAQLASIGGRVAARVVMMATNMFVRDLDLASWAFFSLLRSTLRRISSTLGSTDSGQRLHFLIA